MTTEAKTTPPQIEHLFVRGLRFEGELQYLAKASGKRGARFREIRTPKPGRDGGLTWCSAVAASILGIWPLTEHAKTHDEWKSTDAETIDQLIRQGGLAMIQLGDGYSKWWTLLTGVERYQVRQTVTGMLLLDVTQGLPWGGGYNARVDVGHRSMGGPLRLLGIDGSSVPVRVLRWVELDVSCGA